jgi:hypothetical protein
MQAKTVSVGPVTAAVTNQICASQTPNAGQMVLNGAGVSAARGSINNVATSQNPAAAGNLTLVSAIVQFAQPRYVYVTSASNDSAFTFTITGTDANWNPLTQTITGGNTKAVVTTKLFTSVNAVYVNGDCGSVQVGSFSFATFTGNTARQVTITPTGDESSNSFIVTGTDLNGNTISETVAGGNATASTTNSYFYTVTSITIASNAANAIVAGMTNTAASNWVRFDDFAPSNISIQCTVSGSATYTVQSTLQDPNDPFSPVTEGSLTWVSSSDTAVVGATTTQQSNFLFAPKFARVVLTQTSTGSVSAVFLQSSNGPK